MNQIDIYTNHQSFFHQEHRMWISRLNFYQDEIKFFQNELGVVLHKHINYLSILEHVDEYRNILLKKLKLIDELRHDIIIHEKRIATEIDFGEGELKYHNKIRRKYKRFVDNFEALKKNLKRFVAHND